MRGAHPGTGLMAAVLLLGGSLISLFTVRVQATRLFSPGQDQPVISEFRTSGPAAGYEAQDDFVEIFNPSGHDISLSGWYIESISSSGIHKLLARFPTGAFITPGQHYLITSLHYSGLGTPDDQFATGGIPDGGGVALVNASDQVIDQAGMSAASAEGSPLLPLNGNLDQSYERKPGGADGNCYDSDDNAADFRLIQPSDPQDSHADVLLTICAAPTETPPPSPTDTFTPTDVYTSTFTFTSEWTETVTDTPTHTGTPTKTFTSTRTPTFTQTPSPSNTPTFTKAHSPSRTQTETRTPSLTKTLSPSRTPSETRTPSLTKTLSPSRTFSPMRTSTRTKTPTPVPGYVAINEFLPRPASDWNEDSQANEKDEFIELINLGSTPVKLKGWKLDHGAQATSFHLPDVSIAPGEILVFFRFEMGFPLSDGGGMVRLVKSGGQTADEFQYSPAMARDRTWCRLPDKAIELLFACIPTPGQPNVAYPIGAAVPDDGRICSLPDTTPAGIVLAECEGAGDDVWNEAEREQFWLAELGKWDVFVE